MGKMRGSQSQFEIIIDFMERNGDLCRLPQGSQGRLENLQKWHELAELLNNRLKGEAKPLEKWRKAWSDFKNNTRKKIEKIRRHGGEGPELTDVEKRVLRLMGDKQGRKRSSTHMDSEENGIVFKEEVDMDPCQRSLSTPPRYFCAVEPQTSRQRNNSASSYASSSNSSNPVEKKKRLDAEENLKEITDRFLEFEREKEKMAHEREMARIRQNDQLLAVFGRIVNVLESLAPSIQRYLDQNNNGG